jgi:peptidoglycan hydrolase-like protein with peptidoglycan-binding domain
MPIQRSVGAGGANQFADVKYVQELLNRQTHPAYNFGKIGADGICGPQTINAIKNFQKNVVKLSVPDGRVDPNGRTIGALESGAGAPAATRPTMPARLLTVTFSHGNRTPTASGADMYESQVTVDAKTFQGSIFPDDMKVKGRIKDGTYPLHIGFHKRNGLVPTAADLVVKNNSANLRPALIVNRDNFVPVISNNPAKTTSSAIHVHNGFNSSRGSEGCLTLKPSDWPGFIQIFLDMYPNLNQWYLGPGQYVGLEAGSLVVQA